MLPSNKNSVLPPSLSHVPLLPLSLVFIVFSFSISTPTLAADKTVFLTRANGFNPASVTWAAVAAGSDRPLPLRSLDPPVLLPDGSEFKTWEQPAEHLRTFFVAQNQANASDDNPGTEDRPWKTIGRAPALLEPGDRVIVREGVYREWVRPARGGTGPRRMITYQAAPGQKVVLCGSERYAGPWRVSPQVNQPASYKVWMAELPEAQFGQHSPFALANFSPEQSKKQADYGRNWLGKHPYSLAQGLVFQDGRRLVQRPSCDDLAAAPGTYWVGPGGRRVHLRPFGDVAPQSAAFEFTARPFAFAPEKPGLGFIRVDGFTVQYVASCFPIPQHGAISARQGHHWIVQNNTVLQVNSLGLDYGWRQTFMPYTVPEDTPALAGVGHIVRSNSFIDCGICSMQGLGLFGGLIEDNISSGCGWHRVENLFETGGIKLHYNKHVLVRRNLVQGTIDAPGLWVDHSNVNTRVTANIVVGAKSQFGGIFLEASYWPNLIDHNIVWDCDGHAFYQHDCEHLTVAHNLFGRCTKKPVFMRSGGKRVVDIETNRLATAQHNRVLGNIFYGFAQGPDLPRGDNVSDDNVFVTPPNAKPFDLGAWRMKTGREANSAASTSDMALSPSDWTLHQTPPVPILRLPRLPSITFDLFLTPRSGRETEVGPWVEQNRKPDIELR